MLRTILSSILFLCIFFIQSQAQPTTITYQGKLLDASGNPITNPALPITFSIYNAETVGAKIWPSGASPIKNVNVSNGLYSIILGTGNGNDEAFTSAHFQAGSEAWLEISIDGTVLPRTELTNISFRRRMGKSWRIGFNYSSRCDRLIIKNRHRSNRL